MKTLLLALLLAGTAQAQSTDTAEAAARAGTAAPAAAPVAAAPEASSKPIAQDAGDRKICKLERELGSNRAKRVCRTRTEMDAQSEAARASLSDAQRGN